LAVKFTGIRNVKLHFSGLKKNTAQLFTLFALTNLWMVRSKLTGIGHVCARKQGLFPEREKRL
jgi:hypothetical protein